jgi:Ca-activated chloride channel family protein
MPTFLTPWAGLVGLLALPLITLYILRQRRPEMAVSSTLLWAKALEDARANAPWQRLRRHLLLFIQLAILAILTLTLMRPVVMASAQRVRSAIIVIDCSASMQTTDHGGHSRLEDAKTQALRMIDGMRPGDQIMLLADGGGTSRVDVPFTNDPHALRTAINGLTAADTPTDLSDTLILAATQLRAKGENGSAAAGAITLFSDGVGVTLPEVAGIGDLVRFVQIGDSADNVGITRLAVAPLAKEPGKYEIFVALQNCSGADQDVPIGLSMGKADAFLPGGLRRLTVPAHQSASTVFDLALQPGLLYVQIDPPHDDLKIDNTAFATIEGDRKVRVCLVTAGNALLERYVATARRAGEIDAIIETPEHFNAATPADLFILDGVAPPSLPLADALLIRPATGDALPAQVAGFNILGGLDHPAILRYVRDDPLLAYVELANVRISSALQAEATPQTTTLIASQGGPLLLRRDDGPARRYLLGFSPLLDSNWWQDPSLLIFLENLVSQTRARRFIGRPEMITVGQTATFYDLAATATLTLPDGGSLAFASAGGSLTFPSSDVKNDPRNNTDRVGFYTVSSGGKTATVAVNLLNATVSNIAPARLSTRAGQTVAETASIARVNTEVWPWLAVIGLAVLLGEWWVFHRRLA